MDITRKNYFAFLPYEVIGEIVKYLTTEDYLNLCAVVERLTNFRINKIDLSRFYKVEIDKVPSTINCEGVTSVNLNYCHWLPKATLHNFILELPNVQILSAFDTKLDLTGNDIEILNATKIYRLAVTLSISHSETKCSMQKVEELHLEIDKATVDYFEGNFNQIVQLPNVEKVWVTFLAKYQHNESPRKLPKRKWLRNCNNEKLKHVTFLINDDCGNSNTTDEFKSLQKCFQTGDFGRARVICLEKPLFDSQDFVSYREWERKLYDVENINIPFLQKDAMKLYHGEESLETIKCKELSFGMNEHSEIYSNILEAHAGSVENLEIYGHQDTAFALRILKCQSLINLKRLALYQIVWNVDVDNLHYISKLTLLKFLHVDIPQVKDCSRFLPIVLKNCSYLEQLSLLLDKSINLNRFYEGYQDNFFGHLSSALVYAKNLKELSLQCHKCEFRVDEVISILNCTKRTKLVKLKMLVQKCGNLNADIWKEYFKENEQLMDCVIGIRSLDYNPERKIAKELCKLYQRPYRKLQIGPDYYTEHDLEYTACNLRIDDDFFIINRK